MKCCTRCNISKDLSEYYKQSTGRYGVYSQCKSCMKETNKAWFDRNAEKRSTYNKSRYFYDQKISKQYRDEFKEWFGRLKDNPCVDCGRRFPRCAMQWDHLDGASKKCKVSSMRGKHEKVLEEISKCELVCANCHSVRTTLRIHLRNQGYLNQ